MGRESNDVVIHSSIALLQERFRQLQKAKEMREEREILRMVAESEPIMHLQYEPSKLFQSELMIILPHPQMKPPKSQVSLSLWPPNSSQPSNSSRLTDTSLERSSFIKFDDTAHSDVDTSLHL